MNQFCEDISAFHRRFGFSNRKQAGFIEPEHMQMRLNFLLEELDELAQATGFTRNEGGHYKTDSRPGAEHDLEGALDALVDLQYVLLGTAYLMGLLNDKKVVDEVDEGDDGLPKLYPRVAVIFEEAWDRVHKANMKKQRSLRGDKAKRGGQYDVVKPAGWKAPELSDLL